MAPSHDSYSSTDGAADLIVYAARANNDAVPRARAVRLLSTAHLATVCVQNFIATSDILIVGIRRVRLDRDGATTGGDKQAYWVVLAVFSSRQFNQIIQLIFVEESYKVTRLDGGVVGVGTAGVYINGYFVMAVPLS